MNATCHGHRYLFTAAPLMFVLICASHAATFTVTTNAASGAGSLLEAIQLANGNQGDFTGSHISFNIPGPGPHVITPAPPGLPRINGSIFFTTIGGGGNIILNGSAAGANASGLDVGTFVTAAGLIITGFSGPGILVDTNQTGSYISGCVIASNGGAGIDMKGNVNQIVGNTIASNGGGGIVVRGAFIRNSISQNEIFDNVGLGIDLLTTGGLTGTDINDPCDGDNGGNHLQNHPILTSATSDGTNTTITGTINSISNRVYIVEFFANSACDPSGSGEGEMYIGTSNIATSASSCTAPFTVVLPTPTANGMFITATATEGTDHDTSEFSPCVTLVSTVGQPPVASNDVFSTNQDTQLNVPAPGVLANDTDPDGDPLTAVQVGLAMHGTGTINADGSLTYTPAAGFAGLDLLTYHANDGNNDSADAAVVISVGADTPAGSPSIVQLDASPVGTIDITFAGATVPGSTSIVPIDPSQAGTLPGNFTLYNNIVFDITTTATVTPPIDVCFNLPSVTDPNVWAMLQVMHNEGGTLTNRTTFSDFVLKQICGRVPSLSPFAIALFEPPQVGCALSPAADTNQVGTAHSVVSTVTTNDTPAPGVTVHFEVVSGPNAGATGSSATAGGGQATFMYTSNGTPGTDTIMATGIVSGVSFSCSATKAWVVGPCADLSGTWGKVKSKCKVKNDVETCNLSGSLAVPNAGDAGAGESVVRYFLSDDNVLDGGDTQIGEGLVKALTVGKSGKGKLKATLIDNSPVGRFLLAVIDAGGAVAECDENNNVAAFGPIAPP